MVEFMEVDKKTENRGGKRTPSEGKKLGRPNKEPTSTISFRVPKEQKSILFKAMSEHLRGLLK